MKKLFFISVLFLGLAAAAQTPAQNPFTGFWTTVDDKSNNLKSVAVVYEHDGKLYGRVIKTYADNKKNSKPEDMQENDTIYKKLRHASYLRRKNADGAETPLAYCGEFDFLWAMNSSDGGKTYDGKILNPTDGNIYDSVMKIKDGNLVVRGYIGGIKLLGKSQTWLRVTDTSKIFDDKTAPVPDPAAFTPYFPDIVEKAK